MKRLLITLLFSMVAATPGVAQVTLFPPYVFTDNRTRFGSYRIINDSNTPKEVRISFRFSYGASDSTENMRVVTNDSARAAKFSIVPWIRAFPKQFILQPNQEQTVRFRVGAPDSLDDG